MSNKEVFSLKTVDENKRSKEYNIILCSDNRLVNQIYVLIYSIYKNCKKKSIIWILQNSYTEDQKKELLIFGEKLGIKINLIDVDKKDFLNFNVKRLPVETYFYLNAHNILPNNVHRALVIDIDTIILKDIDDLYNIDFGNKYIVAGNEYEHIKYSDYLKIIQGSKVIETGNVYNTENCFNSGVILLNFDKMREENISIKDFKKVVKESDIGGFFHDQLVINRFMRGNIKIFPRLFYNCSSINVNTYRNLFKQNDKTSIHEVYTYNDLDENKAETIIHFCGVNALKPWDANISIENKIINVNNKILPVQNKYIKIWWEYALNIPNNIFVNLFTSMFYKNNGYNNIQTINYLKSELKIFTTYTDFFKKIIEDKECYRNIINFFVSNRYKEIAFFSYSRITKALIPFLQEYNITTRYIIENLPENKLNNCEVYRRNDYSIPFVDCVIVTEVSDIDNKIKNLEKYISCPVYSVFSIIEEYSKIVRKNIKKNYMYYRCLPKEEMAKELCEWYKSVTGEVLNLNNPITFNEKIQWSKLFETNELRTLLSDKFLVRNWVENKIGKNYLIPLYGVYENFEEINFEILPKSFVIKCNHGSGMNIIIDDKNNINLNLIKEKINTWMSIDYSYICGFEMQYHNIKRKIIIEKKLENNDSHDLYDYKFWCFGGKVKYIQFLSERYTNGLKMAFYDINWVKQDFVYNVPLDDKIIEKPHNLNKMIELSEVLSSGFSYVRVDFYRLNNGDIYFGEMTFTSDSGKSKWSNNAINKELGDLYVLPVKDNNCL